MERSDIAIAVVGVSAILPDAPNADAFWKNLIDGRYSISEVEPSRWDPALYYDADPAVPDKTYSKIGGWVREWEWDPIAWHLPIPPRTADAMDEIQKWAVNLARAALVDYGWPARKLDLERTGVILGNALAGEKQWITNERISVPDFERDLAHAASFAALPASTRSAILTEARSAAAASHPVITEDTMPGELANVIAGRVANLFDLHGPNYITDAACASALAAMNAAVDELIDGHCDTVITGGVDHTMSPTAFVKFCKIGALSATGTRPYAEGADGFVMGEGGAFFLLKRLTDAERDGDRIYAVVRGLGGSSDGKGKGITAPNPVGQKLAVQRAWKTAGLSPATAAVIEGHGTSTRVGDLVEVESLAAILREAGAATGAVGLGSVKSNIGHLKAAAGAAGLLKTVLALHHKVIPPSLNCERPNPALDFEHSPLRVVTALEEWPRPARGVRRAGVSAFGFGGTNFHAVLDEYVPGALEAKRSFALAAGFAKPPPRGAAVIGGADTAELTSRLQSLAAEARAGRVPARDAPAAADLRAPHRVAIDFGTAGELAEKAALALRALEAEPSPTAAAAWKALRARGVFRGRGPARKVAFLYTGQGSQYANMLAELRASEPLVRETFEEADRIMAPLLGRKLTDVIFVDPEHTATAEAALRETEITQPAVMTADLALTRLLAAYGVKPDMVMGHSLGEYGALMAAGSLTFEHTLEAVSARGREMSHLVVADRGLMAAVIAPFDAVEKAVAGVGSGVVIANVNSSTQAVIGGPSEPMRKAIETLAAAGHQVIELPVSHAFHTSIVAPVSEPLRQTLVRLDLRPPHLPVVSNVTGQFYPTGDGALSDMLSLLGRQVAEPVQFVAGLRTLYDAGARVFVEVGPKRALQTFAEDVLGAHDDVVTLFTNHPKTGELESFNQALCGLYAAGLGTGVEPSEQPAPAAAGGRGTDEPVAITGAALGLPGTDNVFDDLNIARILNGDQFIDVVPARFRKAMLDKHITRLVKREGADPTFETIEDPDAVIRLAGRAGRLDLVEDFGVPRELVDALDRTTQLAMGAGLDALRDAGIPLVMHYRTTTTGGRLPEHWALGEPMRDDTGVIFASAMPGLDQMARTITAYERAKARDERLAALKRVRDDLASTGEPTSPELDRQIDELRRTIAREPFVFDRRFLFRVLSMGHSQFAQYIGARGPNTQINAACASTTQAISLAQDWIRAGRCRRVLVIAGDDPTSDALMEWVGSGFLASGAAATDDVVENAAIPFDRRRHGMLIGMGAAALVVESAGAARERGIAPICDVLATASANSAFHGTRLDPRHIAQVMESLVAQAERESGIRRSDIAARTVFVSHETYTPARGGSAAAEVDSLRAVFGADAAKIVIANTKGFTGHPMGVGIEDVVAVKALETGLVPPVPNFKEEDPDLGPLTLSRGGAYRPDYALRLAAGFGSQISLALLRRVAPPEGARPAPDDLGYRRRIADPMRWQAWLQRIAGRPDPELEVVARTLRVKDVARIPTPAPVPDAHDDPAPQPVQAAVAATPSADGADPIAGKVLALVAEKTGYPPDMLGLDLDLEADLGIDTVKQAELFSALRETYGFERDANLKLRDFPTLAHVIRFVHERSAGGPLAKTTDDRDEEADDDGFPRRVPVPVLRPAADLCAATAVELAAGTRVLVVGGGDETASELTRWLGERGVEVLLVDGRCTAEELRERIAAWTSPGGVRGVYWLPALDAEPALAELDLAGWREGLRRRVGLLHTSVRALGDGLGKPGTFLVSATLLGGRHGYGDRPATSPMGGAVAGFTKAFHRERPEALVKVVDFAPGGSAAERAAQLIEETLWDPATVEVGRADGERWSVGLERREAGRSDLALTRDTVFVVTGAAGSIVSAIVTDLTAASSGGIFHLLDLAPEPDAADPDVARFARDREGLKSELTTRLRAAGERPTPAMIEKRMAALERSYAALAAMEAVRSAGGQCIYHSLDITDAAAVAAALDDVRRRHGRIDVLVHAAGIEISHLLPDKDEVEFGRVLSVKADGWFNLIKAAEGMPLGAALAFSSVAGRFGNAGQTDYSAANDLLCKSVSNLRGTRPDTHAVAIDWTAWAEIGMATRGSIPRLMELAGIEMLPPRAGIAAVRRELLGGGSGEVVVAGRLGALLDQPGSGGVDPAADAWRPRAPLVARVLAMTDAGLSAEAALDPHEQPFLDHHRIDGTPVLPGVMGIELMAELAALPLSAHRVTAIENVEFSAPFKFYRDEPRTVRLEARYLEDGADIVAHCRLIGVRALSGREEPQVTTHFTADVRLGAAVAPAPEVAVPASPAGAAVSADSIRRVYFHGPSFQVLDAAWRDGERMVGRFATGLPPAQSPAEARLVIEPRLLELCFQTVGAIEIGASGRLALPARVGRIQLHDATAATGPCFAVARRAGERGFDADVVDGAGRAVLEVRAYETVEVPLAVDSQLLQPFQVAAVAPQP